MLQVFRMPNFLMELLFREFAHFRWLLLLLESGASVEVALRCRVLPLLDATILPVLLGRHLWDGLRERR